MDKNVIIPIALFLCVTYTIKIVVDAYSRRKLLQIHGPTEDFALMLENEAAASRQNSLRWGLVLLAIGIGFGLLELFNLRDVTAGMFAILLGMTGLGHLVYFFLARHLR
ncbi:DUF6249 domain-containing protein [Pinirhizobacter soli]|uniref:DUF6249 domain-containing protein n=1 Tax=Pinirhizobacter soli TaxID=2786953 RepID=UPI00202A3F93|nr:DUF6249 domain-containing protein [Pinirhizobacter soli]